MKKIATALLVLFFLSSPALAEEEKLYLVCKVENTSLTFVVDFKNNTLSGKPALISDTMISCEDGVDKVTIDRYSGSITIISKGQCINGTDCIYYGNCSRQQSRQF